MKKLMIQLVDPHEPSIVNNFDAWFEWAKRKITNQHIIFSPMIPILNSMCAYTAINRIICDWTMSKESWKDAASNHITKDGGEVDVIKHIAGNLTMWAICRVTGLDEIANSELTAAIDYLIAIRELIENEHITTQENSTKNTHCHIL